MTTFLGNITIDDQETRELARQLSEMTGEPLEQAIKVSVKERLRTIQSDDAAHSLEQILNELAVKLSQTPVIDHRSPDEIIGYDEVGLP